MFFNVVAWGMSWVNVRAVLPEVGAGQLGAMRYLIASSVMLPIWLYRGRPLPARGDWPVVASLGLFGFCLSNLGINYGERTVNAGTGSMPISCIPVLVILLGVLTGRERVGLLAWLGIGLSMAGVVLTAAGSAAGLTFNLGSLLILGAALCAAIQTLISKALTQRYAAVDVTTWAVWVGTLGLLPFSADLVGTARHLSRLGLGSLGLPRPGPLCPLLPDLVLGAGETAHHDGDERGLCHPGLLRPLRLDDPRRAAFLADLAGRSGHPRRRRLGTDVDEKTEKLSTAAARWRTVKGTTTFVPLPPPYFPISAAVQGAVRPLFASRTALTSAGVTAGAELPKAERTYGRTSASCWSSRPMGGMGTRPYSLPRTLVGPDRPCIVFRMRVCASPATHSRVASGG